MFWKLYQKHINFIEKFTLISKTVKLNHLTEEQKEGRNRASAPYVYSQPQFEFLVLYISLILIAI